MVLRVGIDEAGYGPLLGPLVVGASVWRVIPENATADLWERLSGAVRRSPRGGDGRLPICDSKDLFDQKSGVGTLERQVLAFARAADLPCDTLEALLGGLLRGAGSGFQRQLPWYRELSVALPRDRVHGRCDAATVMLRAACERGGAQCVALLAQVVSEDVFNERLLRTQNKAAIVLEQVLRLIERSTRMAGAGEVDVHIVVDRLGGRANYRDVLMHAFPDRETAELEYSETCSRYRLSDGGQSWTIGFLVEAEQQHLPVALASMTAKYVRELLMEQFNGWWRMHEPELRSTAGYYGDAERFLTDISALIPASGVSRSAFVRSR